MSAIRTRLIGFGLGALLIAGCGGNSGVVPGQKNVTPSRAGFAKATFAIHWPSAQATSSIHRLSLSKSTLSISFALNGAAPQILNRPAGGANVTSAQIDAPIGTDNFTIEAWDQPGATGNVLDTAQVSAAILADANNVVSATLDAVCAGLVLANTTSSPFVTSTSSNVPLTSGGTLPILQTLRIISNQTATITTTPIDADGNIIISSAGKLPITLVESNSIPHFTIVPASNVVGNSTFAVTPIVSLPSGTTETLTATSPNCGQGTPFAPNHAATTSVAAVYVADQTNGILVFDQDGNAVTTFGAGTKPVGLTLVPQTGSTAPYLIAIDQIATTGGGTKNPAFTTYSLTGTKIATGSLPSISIKNGATTVSTTGYLAGNVAYNAANGNVVLALRQYIDSTNTTHYGYFVEYKIGGLATSTAVAVTPSGTYPFFVSGASGGPPPYDPTAPLVIGSNILGGDSQTNSYLYDQNANYINNYTTTAISFALDTVKGIVYDLNTGGNYLYVYNPNLSSASNTYFYLPYSGVPAASTVAVNPASGYVYVFGPNGASVGNPAVFVSSAQTLQIVTTAGNFPGIAVPTQAVVVQ